MKHYLFIFLALIVATRSFADTTTPTIEFNHCYDYSCKSSQSLRFSDRQWFFIEKIFIPPALSSWLEKQQIRQAIALMEAFAGDMTGTNQDRAGNYVGEVDIPQQQDCIDESTNTAQYLSALQQRNLLRWHRAEGRKRRMVWLATHWTAVISEKDSQKYFAVDSWYRDNGEPPYIQLLSEWQRKKSFSKLLNP